METFAPVFSIASAKPKTSSSIVGAVLRLVGDGGTSRAFTPTTMLVPRCEHACGVLGTLTTRDALPNDDLESLFTKIDILLPLKLCWRLRFVSELCCLVGAGVHGSQPGTTSGWFASEGYGDPQQRCSRPGAQPKAWLLRRPGISRAFTMPSATASLTQMPPKTFTKTLLTCSSPRADFQTSSHNPQRTRRHQYQGSLRA